MLKLAEFVNNFTKRCEGPRSGSITWRLQIMRYLGMTALAASAIVLGACGGGEKKAADSTAATTADSTTPVTSATPAAGAVAAAPITGTTHEVKMVGDDKGYRFEPAALTIKAGDGIKFINVTGGPHNVSFDPAAIAADVKPQLAANMPTPASELSSPMLVNPNDSYTVSFGNIKAGTYEVHCTPHMAMNMKMTVTVQ
jgi:plastocyanin